MGDNVLLLDGLCLFPHILQKLNINETHDYNVLKEVNLNLKTMKITSTYLPRGVSAALTKLGPFLLANVVFFAYSVIDTVLVGCKCLFWRQIRLKLSPPFSHILKYFILCPNIRCFRDIKFSLTNNKLGFIVNKWNFLANKEYARWKLKYLNILPYQILLSSRDLLPSLVCHVDLIMSDNPQICS